MVDFSSDKLEYISRKIAEKYVNMTDIDDVLSIVAEDKYLVLEEKLFVMFAIGRRYQNAIIKTKIDNLFLSVPEDQDDLQEEPEED